MSHEKAPGTEILVVVSGSPDADAPFLERLQAAGYDIAQCKDPSFANKIVESKPRGWSPALFLVDVIIPKSSGFEIVRRIIAAYGKLNIPVVMMSPYAMPEDVAEASSAGAAALLKKPVSPEMITAFLEQYRAKKTGASDLREGSPAR